MLYQIGYYLMLIIAFIIGLLCFWNFVSYSKTNKRVRFRRNRLREFKNVLKNKAHSSNSNIFSQVGINVSLFSYQMIRFCLIISYLIITVYIGLESRQFPKNQIFTLFILIFLSIPKMKFLNISLPFGIVINALTHEYKKKKNKEVYRAVFQLKNIAITRGHTSLGSDYILNELMKYSRVIKPIFCKMICFWNEADQNTACDYFANAVGTKEGRELANLFLKLDSLDAAELKEHIMLIQNIIDTERVTQKEKSNENKGNIIYGFVIASALIVLLNFAVIVLFIDSLAFLDELNFIF